MPRTCWSALSPAERGSSNTGQLSDLPVGRLGTCWEQAAATTEAAPRLAAGRLRPTSCITPHLLRWAVGGKGNLQYGAVADRTGDLDRPAQRLDPVVQPGQTGAVLWLRSTDAIVRHA